MRADVASVLHVIHIFDSTSPNRLVDLQIRKYLGKFSAYPLTIPSTRLLQVTRMRSIDKVLPLLPRNPRPKDRRRQAEKVQSDRDEHTVHGYNQHLHLAPSLRSYLPPPPTVRRWGPVSSPATLQPGVRNMVVEIYGRRNFGKAQICTSESRLLPTSLKGVDLQLQTTYDQFAFVAFCDPTMHEPEYPYSLNEQGVSIAATQPKIEKPQQSS